MLTAVGIKEPDKAVFMAGNDDTFDTGARHGPSTACWAASTPTIFLIETSMLVESDCRGNNGVDGSRDGTVIGLEARHVSDLFARAGIVDDNSGIRIAHHEGVSVRAEGSDACWAGV